MVVGSEDGNIYHYDLIRGSIIRRMDLNSVTASSVSSSLSRTSKNKIISSLAYHPKKALLLAAQHDGTAKCIEVASFE